MAAILWDSKPFFFATYVSFVVQKTDIRRAALNYGPVTISASAREPQSVHDPS